MYMYVINKPGQLHKFWKLTPDSKTREIDKILLSFLYFQQILWLQVPL